MKYSTAHSPKWIDSTHTAIDLFITFDELGEVPFRATPNDIETHGVDIFNKAVAGDFGPVAEFIEDILTPEQIQLQTEYLYKSEIQKILDGAAIECGYDNIISACSYAALPGKYQAEAISFFNWRTAVWDYCTDFLNAVMSGSADVPELQELIDSLPTRVIPVV